LKPNDVVTTSG